MSSILHLQLLKQSKWAEVHPTNCTETMLMVLADWPAGRRPFWVVLAWRRGGGLSSSPQRCTWLHCLGHHGSCAANREKDCLQHYCLATVWHYTSIPFIAFGAPWPDKKKSSSPALEHKMSLLFVDCLTSQQHASVSQGWIFSNSCTYCHTETEVADQTFYLTRSQYTNIRPTSPSAEPITSGALQGSH